MRKIISIAVVAALCWVGYQSFHRAQLARQSPDALTGDPGAQQPEPEAPQTSTNVEADAKYHCDGRQRCPQMHSCEEATWFINHCPGMEMDGDGDGVPCESQWCK